MKFIAIGRSTSNQEQRSAAQHLIITLNGTTVKCLPFTWHDIVAVLMPRKTIGKNISSVHWTAGRINLLPFAATQATVARHRYSHTEERAAFGSNTTTDHPIHREPSDRPREPDNLVRASTAKTYVNQGSQWQNERFLEEVPPDPLVSSGTNNHSMDVNHDGLYDPFQTNVNSQRCAEDDIESEKMLLRTAPSPVQPEEGTITITRHVTPSRCTSPVACGRCLYFKSILFLRTFVSSTWAANNYLQCTHRNTISQPW